jgi:hypothetical protein
MQAREAKDFLVRQVQVQAQLEGVPFSDLERRMLYFTEGPEAAENPIELNEEFEKEYDTDEYEAKMSKLFSNAYKRLKKENPAGVSEWNKAIEKLETGDHYILILCGKGYGQGFKKERAPHDLLKLFFAGILLTAAVLSILLLASHFGTKPSKEANPPWWMSRRLHQLVTFVLLLWLGRILVKYLNKAQKNEKGE